jgi:predicted outer membrane repeat protein
VHFGVRGNSVISGNSAAGFGGGLGNAPGAKATVIGSTFSGNSAATGGGLASQGHLVMKGSLVTRNTASAAGGIAKLGGTVVLRATTMIRNAPDNCEPAISGCTG